MEVVSEDPFGLQSVYLTSRLMILFNEIEIELLKVKHEIKLRFEQYQILASKISWTGYTSLGFVDSGIADQLRKIMSKEDINVEIPYNYLKCVRYLFATQNIAKSQNSVYFKHLFRKNSSKLKDVPNLRHLFGVRIDTGVIPDLRRLFQKSKEASSYEYVQFIKFQFGIKRAISYKGLPLNQMFHFPVNCISDAYLSSIRYLYIESKSPISELPTFHLNQLFKASKKPVNEKVYYSLKCLFSINSKTNENDYVEYAKSVFLFKDESDILLYRRRTPSGSAVFNVSSEFNTIMMVNNKQLKRKNSKILKTSKIINF
eukprot:NODE_201_length_13147_cov_1.076104.p6 type:complete len:315 gc:universal NODE_201_length_13147_cov_1.076104:10315-9371(-)